MRVFYTNSFESRAQSPEGLMADSVTEKMPETWFINARLACRLTREPVDLTVGLEVFNLLDRRFRELVGIDGINQPDWSDDSRTLAFTARGSGEYFHVILNAYWKPLRFKLPPVPGGTGNGWHRVIDTDRESPEDICERADAPAVRSTTYLVKPRSVVLLVGEDGVESGKH